MLVAALVFAIATVAAFGPIWTAGARVVTPTQRIQSAAWAVIAHTDVEAEAWIVARGAYTLVNRPRRFFDAEECAPVRNSLTYGPAMLTAAIVAIPAYLLTGDRVLTYNVNLVLYSVLGAVGMFLLITEWTGLPAAGLVAGVLFGFHAVRLGEIQFPMDVNLGWTAFALFFARRLLAHGRWRDSIGLAVAVTLQMWESMYTLLAAVFGCIPISVWLLARYGVRHVRLSQLAWVVGAPVVGAVLYFAPYLSTRQVVALHRTAAQQVFSPWTWHLPGGRFFLGGFSIALILCAFVLGRRRNRGGALGDGDPRWALLAGALCVQIIAAGPHTGSMLQSVTGAAIHIPNFYAFFAEVIPGLDALRKVSCIAYAVLLLGCMLAGMGAAALIRSCRQYGNAVAAALVVGAMLEVTRPSALGLPPAYEWQMHSIAADEDAIRFFHALEELGNAGPVLELPVELGLKNNTIGMSRITLSYYHHRRISACMGSYRDRIPGRDALIRLADRLPESDAVQEIRALGFTTVVIDPKIAGPAVLQRFIEKAQHPESSGVRLVYSKDETSAFELVSRAESMGMFRRGPNGA